MLHVANMLQIKANYIFLLILSGSINAPFSKKKEKKRNFRQLFYGSGFKDLKSNGCRGLATTAMVRLNNMACV